MKVLEMVDFKSVHFYLQHGFFETLLNHIAPNRVSILNEWTNKLVFRDQSTLLSAIRGNDNETNDSKKITKMLRYLIVKKAGKKNSYMSNYVVRHNIVINILMNAYKNGEKHWVEHILGAGIVVSRSHPDNYVKTYWGAIISVLNKKIKDYTIAEDKRLAREALIKRVIKKYEEIYFSRHI